MEIIPLKDVVPVPKRTFIRDSIDLRREISDFYRLGLFTDVVLVFSDGELRAHRVVLASASNYLKALLMGDAVEGCYRVELPDFNLQEGRTLFEIIYGFLGEEDSKGILEKDLLSLVRTLRIHRALPAELKALISLRNSSVQDEEDEDNESEDIPLESLLQSTHTVAIRRSQESIKTCNHCQSSWDDELKLKNHILIDHNGIVQCSECPLHFDEYAEFQSHREDHYEPPQASPPPSKPKKRRKSSPKKPASSPGNKKPGPKPVVQSASSSSSTTTTYRPTSPGHFKCEHCPDKVFESQTILDYHKLRHGGGDSFACTHCDRRFNSENGLKYHLNKHEGVADFLCDDCGSRFITRQKLLNHRRSKHTFERPYVCETCGDAFTRSDKLTVHIRRAHTGEKPYQCEYCEWRGVDSSALIHHKKKHGPDKMTKTIKRYVHMPQ